MYCIIPLVLGFVAGRTCGYGGGYGCGYGSGCGRRYCRSERCYISECRGRRY